MILGKTKVSTALVNNLKLDLYHTPPKRIKFLKGFFDELEEPLRRAFYSLGNYLTAQDILSSQFYNGVVIDRYLRKIVFMPLTFDEQIW